jgi:alkyl sulfatase BDS1-like metallo-beta-lactamase superfamily hydrolase
MLNRLLNGPGNEGMNSGAGPLIKRNTPAFLPRTRTFADHFDLTVAGVELKLVCVPSQASSEIAVFLPQNRVPLSAAVVQGPNVPNLYTPCGAVCRDPLQ